jgi:hypothetical protein
MGEMSGDSLLRSLTGLLDTVLEAVATADPESVQRATVYAVASEHLAPLVREPEEKVFRALAAMCGEPWEGADPRVVAALRRAVVRMTVAYDVAQLGPVSRELEIWCGADHAGLERKRIRQSISWDDTPADVRRRRLEHGDPTVSFQLFP